MFIPGITAPHYFGEWPIAAYRIRPFVPENVQSIPSSASRNFNGVAAQIRAGDWVQLPEVAAQHNIDAAKQPFAPVKAALVRPLLSNGI